MSRVIPIFLILALLSYTFSYATRPVVTLSKTTTSTATLVTKMENKDDVEESCEGLGKEECLTRRILVAHLDYIYTQEKNPRKKGFLSQYILSFILSSSIGDILDEPVNVMKKQTNLRSGGKSVDLLFFFFFSSKFYFLLYTTP
ncbi:putative phytosulfokine [Helianthus debilis subsp. tardiflorus]